MPRGDRTGPLGQGAMTGRRLGNCNSTNAHFVGYGRGRGYGMGYSNIGNRTINYNNAPTLETEKEYLESRLNEVNELLKK